MKTVLFVTEEVVSVEVVNILIGDSFKDLADEEADGGAIVMEMWTHLHSCRQGIH